MKLFTLSALAALLFSTLAFAQGPSSDAKPASHTSTVPSGTTVRDADGREINVGAGGGCTVTYEGRLRNHPQQPGVKICDKIKGCAVRSGGCHTLTIKGKLKADIDRSSTTVTSSGTGQGNPPSTEGADINVNGDNITVNANGTNTNVNTGSGAQGTTVNTGPGSSGSVNYSGGSGSSTTVNYGAGSGSWTSGPAQ